MIISATSVVALALALQGQPATTDQEQTPAETAQASQATASTETPKEANDEDRIICKRTAILGSKFTKRICGTAKEWQKLAQRGTDTAQEMRKKGKGGTPSESGF